MNTPSDHPTSEDADGLLVGSVSFPQTSAPTGSAGAVRDGEPAVGPPPCGSLLGEFLALMGRMEVDFTRRWDIARLGDPRGSHQQDPHHGWPRDV